MVECEAVAAGFGDVQDGFVEGVEGGFALDSSRAWELRVVYCLGPKVHAECFAGREKGLRARDSDGWRVG